MRRIGQYIHTIRYLKPIQIFGRIWFWVHRPAVRATSAPPVRRSAGRWQQSPPKPHSLLSASRFRFLNEEHGLSSAADWNNPAWGKLWLYNLHYFDDLNAESVEARSDWHRALIAGWVAENPVGLGNGWEPYPLSLRIVNWVKWAWTGSGLPPAAIESLALQARFLRRRLEWHILGNHLLANAKALIFAGLFFEGAEAERWLAKGASIFSDQLKEQVQADGGHFERSPMYHAQVLEDVLDVANAIGTIDFAPGPATVQGNIRFSSIDGNANESPPHLSALQTQCLSLAPKMLAWLGVMSHPDGEMALLNDAALGGAPAPAALAAYAKRLGIEPGRPPVSAESESGEVRITHLEDTGYIRVDCAGMAAFLDAAPIGPDYLPGHAHADTLSFELSLGRQRVIVDSGVSRYGEGPERLRQRGTTAHNTVAIDGQDSSEVWGGFRVARRAYPRDLVIREAEGFVACSHDGYRRLPGKPVHRREWRFSVHGLQIRDRIEGPFREAAGYLHFHPDLQLTPTEHCRGGRISLPDGRAVHWRIVQGRARLVDTTWHPEFGKTIPNQCLEIHFDSPETIVQIAWGSGL